MTLPYDDVIIHKLQYATTWLVKHTGEEGGQTSRHGAEREEKSKNKNKEKKNKNKIKIKANQIQKREKIDKEIKRRKIEIKKNKKQTKNNVTAVAAAWRKL